ncbi:TetR family transcriptional regulator C-terminal domain-containing protein [Streptomyces sp. NPDC002676]
MVATIGEAKEVGEVRTDTDSAQLAFELVALLEMASAESVLHGNFMSLLPDTLEPPVTAGLAGLDRRHHAI